MESFGPPELLCDFRVFGRQQALRDALQAGESQLVLDGAQLIVRLPHSVQSFPRLPAPPSAYLHRTWAPGSAALTGLLLPAAGRPLALVWENGRAELWSPPQGPSGWGLVQSLSLFSSPRARLVSVCSSGEDLVWCEERPPSKPTAKLHSCCVCKRSLVNYTQPVTPGNMKIILHHSPSYQLYSSSKHIFMVPHKGAASHLLLIYSYLEQKITMSSTSRGRLHSRSLTQGDSDFQKMVVELLGIVASDACFDTLCCTVTAMEELLLLDASGQVHLLYPDGATRHVYKFDNQLVCEAHIGMQLFEGTLACALDAVLYLIDLHTGRLMEKIILSADMRLLKVFGSGAFQFLTKAGIYTVSRGPVDKGENNRTCEPALLEMIFEEACKYYQRRSLSSTRLTVHSLKQEGIFQAPITLSSIVKCFQKKEKPLDEKFTDLLSIMYNELQNYLGLERLKACIINADGNDVESYCEDLVDQEISRLLVHIDLDRENLLYINSLFTMFPKASWKSIRNNLQICQNGDGKLVVRATSDVWRKVLGPLPPGCKESSQNGVRPLFEVICQSLYTFKPKWLPFFVQHAQECGELSWGFSNKEKCEQVPLYKRAMSVLNKRKENTTVDRELEIDILLYSGRPLAIVQAIHILIGSQRWERVMEETKRYSVLSPVISKDIFITLLVELVKHRYLDAYIDQICDICPVDMTATAILRIVLQNLPQNTAQTPLPPEGGRHLTVGLLKPLLNKVLQNQVKAQKTLIPTFPPSTPQRADKAGGEQVFGNGFSPGYSPVTDIYSTNDL
ncbi:BLOC-2 complex member HPS6 [Pelodytes ibericus]